MIEEEIGGGGVLHEGGGERIVGLFQCHQALFRALYRALWHAYSSLSGSLACIHEVPVSVGLFCVFRALLQDSFGMHTFINWLNSAALECSSSTLSAEVCVFVCVGLVGYFLTTWCTASR